MPPRPLHDNRPLSVRLAEVVTKLRSSEFTPEFGAEALNQLGGEITAIDENLGVCVQKLTELLSQPSEALQSSLDEVLVGIDILISIIQKDENNQEDPAFNVSGQGTERLSGGWTGKGEVVELFTADDNGFFISEDEVENHDAQNNKNGFLPETKNRLSVALGFTLMTVAIVLGAKIGVDWHDQETPAEMMTPVAKLAPPPAEPAITPPTPEVTVVPPPPEAPITVEVTPPPATQPTVAVAITEGTAFLILRDSLDRRGQWVVQNVAMTQDGNCLFHGAPVPPTCWQVKEPGSFRQSKTCPQRELLYWFDD